MLREAKYLTSINEIPTDKSRKRKVDFTKVNDFIEISKETLRYVDIGFSEDVSASYPYWDRECGYLKYEGLHQSSWATPTAFATFIDGDELIFAVEETKKKKSFWKRLFNRR